MKNSFFILSAAAVLATGCKKDDPQPEVVTNTVTVHDTVYQVVDSCALGHYAYLVVVNISPSIDYHVIIESNDQGIVPHGQWAAFHLPTGNGIDYSFVGMQAPYPLFVHTINSIQCSTYKSVLTE